jgi:hypothetical protein
MDANRNKIIQEVGIALLSSAISLNPDAFRRIASNHGLRPADDLVDLQAQIMSLVHDKQAWVLQDIAPVLEKVGYFDPVALGVIAECCHTGIQNNVATFDVASLGIAAEKIGYHNLETLINKIKEHHDQNKNSDEKEKKDGLLKNIFGKLKDKLSGGGKPKTTDDVANDSDAKKLANGAGKGAGDKGDKKDPKTILGMKVWVFSTIAAGVVLLFVLFLWFLHKAKVAQKSLETQKAAA